MRTLDIVAETFLENISNIIEYDDNLCQEVKITYPYEKTIEVINKTEDKTSNSSIAIFGYGNITTDTFGYETKPEDPKIKYTKGLINYPVETKFLRKLGISLDSENGTNSELPILAFFKQEDDIIKDCRIDVIIRNIQSESNKLEEIERSLIVSDIKSVGFGVPIKYIYILTPLR